MKQSQDSRVGCTNRLEKIVSGNQFGQQIKFNPCATETSKVVALLETEVL